MSAAHYPFAQKTAKTPQTVSKRAAAAFDCMMIQLVEGVMRKQKMTRLARAGFKVGSVQEFLGLSDQEMALIELKVRLVELLHNTRQSKGVTQQELAVLLASSQSRVAKTESGGADAELLKISIEAALGRKWP